VYEVGICFSFLKGMEFGGGVDMDSKPENYNTAMKFTMTDAKAVTSGGSTTCTIAQIVMEGPAAGKGGKEEADEDFRGGVFGSLDILY
jgi:hypothetical protein